MALQSYFRKAGRMATFHPIEPIPAGIANGRSEAFLPVAVACNERLLECPRPDACHFGRHGFNRRDRFARVRASAEVFAKSAAPTRQDVQNLAPSEGTAAIRDCQIIQRAAQPRRAVR